MRRRPLIRITLAVSKLDSTASSEFSNGQRNSDTEAHQDGQSAAGLEQAVAGLLIRELSFAWQVTAVDQAGSVEVHPFTLHDVASPHQLRE